MNRDQNGLERWESQQAKPVPSGEWAAPSYPTESRGRLASEDVVVSAPMSFAGSAQRIWKMTRSTSGAVKWLVGSLAAMLILVVWCVVLAWYLFWGIWLVPYRLLRRGSRKRKITALQHRETLDALQKR